MTFYETPEWKALSAAVRARDRRCLRCNSIKMLCADHIIPRALRADLELVDWNLQTLCWQCNERKSDYYIISYLAGPDARLLNELSVEKTKLYNQYKIAAEKSIRRENIRAYERREKLEPNEIELAEMAFEKLVGLPETASSPIIAIPLFLIRFALIPFLLPIQILLSVVSSSQKNKKTKPSAIEIERFSRKWVDQRFNDWNAIEIVDVANAQSTLEKPIGP